MRYNHSFPSLNGYRPLRQLIPQALELFVSLASTQPATFYGKSSLKFANNLEPGMQLGVHYGLADKRLTREEVRKAWRDPRIPTESCFLHTMAWGGMKLSNGRDLWRNRSSWLPLVNDIRSGRYSRHEAYAKFQELRVNRHLAGMGVAYFTKVIFHAPEASDGYILDQWTARGIHLLTGQRSWPRVTIDYATLASARPAIIGGFMQAHKIRATVADTVTPVDYENFCCLIEQIACKLKIEPHRAEERLFGVGGRSPSPWRRHVMEHWYALPLNSG